MRWNCADLELKIGSEGTKARLKVKFLETHTSAASVSIRLENLVGTGTTTRHMEQRASHPDKQLIGLMEMYKQQSYRCQKAGAYFAACVCLGSAMEAGLLAMAKCYPEDLETSQTYQHKKELCLEKWTLFDLLKLARELSWIPSQIPLEKVAHASGVSPDDALSKGDLGYFADVVREIRDMVHPGRYLRLWRGVRISKDYYEFCAQATELVFDYLYPILEKSISEELNESKKA